MNPHDTPPQGDAAKPHRAAATLASIQCLSCGAALDLRGFAATRDIHCLHCGSLMREDEGGALAVYLAAQRARRSSILTMHAFAELEGQTWQIIGIVWRKTEYDGIVFPWQEFLLFNPYLGYRWLIYSMSDHHWSLGRSMKGAPDRDYSGKRPRVEFKGHSFKHFQNSEAEVVYVEGEFPWTIKVQDCAIVDDFVHRNRGISIERSATDQTFTEIEHIEPEQVWQAFKLAGDPPQRISIGPVQPNPYTTRQRSTWICFAGLFALWLLATGAYWTGRTNQQVFAEDVSFRTQGQVAEVFSRELDIGEVGRSAPVEFSFKLSTLDNDWAYARLMLINQGTEEAIQVGVEVDEWHGVSGGERWREGDKAGTAIAADVPGGRYLVQVLVQSSPKNGHVAHRGQIRLQSDVPLLRYVLLSLLLVVLIPIGDVLLSLLFEGRRWQHSDYGPSST